MELPMGGILAPGAHDFLKICGGGGGSGGLRNLYCASASATAVSSSSQSDQLVLCKEFSPLFVTSRMAPIEELRNIDRGPPLLPEHAPLYNR